VKPTLRGSLFWLRFFSALFAFAVAIFWFLSASVKMPPITYLGFTPAHDPFFDALAAPRQ
jgi:hypothetical protein